MIERQFQPERSILGLAADSTVKFGPTKIHRVILNRKKNILRPHTESFPKCDKALVIGAGCSMSIYADMFIHLDRYQAIFITHPMAAHYSKLLSDDRVWVVDSEYQPIGAHYYDKWAKDVQLICRLGKDIPDEINYKNLCFVLPEDREWNINTVDELVPEKPYSSGAMAMWYAVNKLGDNCHIDYIGIDNDGLVCRYWQETRFIINSAKGRTTNLAAHLMDWPDKVVE